VGSSFTRLAGRGFWASDAAVEVWLFLLAREADQLADAPSWLREAARDWHANATLGVIGCVSAGLDDVLTSPERVAAVIGLSEKALQWVRDHRPVLPADLLNSFGLGGPGSCFTRDVEVAHFLRVGEAFLKLLRGELTTDVASPPVH
jgi:hypothetical protein